MNKITNMHSNHLFLTILIFCTNLFATNIYAKSSLTYFFTTPAANWNEAIPIGNGRIGGMVFGGVAQEKIQTNDDTFWSGEPRDYQKPGAYQYLANIRQMLFSGNTTGAQTEIDSKMLGPYNESYMPLADIILNMTATGTATNYRRELDLTKGVVTVSYSQNGVNYKREIFASYPDQAIVIRITADKANSIGLNAQLTSLVNFTSKADSNQVTINGNAPQRVEPDYTGNKNYIYTAGHGTRFQGKLVFNETDGTITTSGTTLTLQNASYVTISFVVATSFNGFDKDPFANGKNEKALCQAYKNTISGTKFQDLYNSHVKDFQSLFGRVNLDLGTSADTSLPIDQRISAYNKSKDPALTTLYFQFGRYLLISSSRPGSQPANLQGIWNNQIQPAWSANWTLNCNAEINYWPVEAANLSECHLPLIQLTQDASVDGAKTAQNLYNSRGWMAHHNVDVWRTTWPVGGSGKWAIFQVGGAWLCQHVWDHYLFTQDKTFLSEHYELLKGACLFYLDNLQQDQSGTLVTNPSVSFENIFKKADGTTGWACQGPSQDMQIIRALFKNTMAAIDILKQDTTFKTQIKTAFNKLPPIKISPTTGRIQEWNDDWEASTPGNGQVAQGWGVVESDLITLHGTPTLAKAFRKTIEYRKPGLSENSGSWTGAFSSNFWARLGEGDSAQLVIDRHFSNALYPNFTCKFFNAFQIDGNLGITSAVNEMLLQSHAGEIALLPALPSKYPTGYVTGLKARGGYKVDIDWEYGHATTAKIYAEADSNTCKVYYPGIQSSTVTDKNGQSISYIKSSFNQIAFPTIKNGEYTIAFNNASILPYVRINRSEQQLLSTISIKSGDTLSIIPVTALTGGSWKWSGYNYNSINKDLVINKINVTQAGVYKLTYMAGTDTTNFTFSVIVNSKVIDSVNTVLEGDYYIKKRGTELYWTNTATTLSTSGGSPTFLAKGGGTLANAQVWSISKDNGFYKVVSKADGRYVNEGGAFGTNLYYSNWNTYNLYHDGIYTAVQITQNGASAKGGTLFWNLNSTNSVVLSSNSSVDETKDLIFEFVYKPVEPTKTKQNVLPVGDYYIKKRGTQLYWTNIASTISATGGSPSFLAWGKGTLTNAQVWTISKENGYYKIVNKADGRYLHEKGAFGTNTYYNTWNTYAIYSDSIYNAVQITQNAATNKGGAYFWNLDSNNLIAYSTTTFIEDVRDLVFEFIPIQTTTLNEKNNLHDRVWSEDGALCINSQSVVDAVVYDMKGAVVKKMKVDGGKSIPLTDGLYLVSLHCFSGSKTYKVRVN